MVRESTLNEDFAVFKILSPICLKQHMDKSNKDFYVSIDDEGFACELERKLIKNLPYYKEKIKNMTFNFNRLRKRSPKYSIFAAPIGTPNPKTIAPTSTISYSGIE